MEPSPPVLTCESITKSFGATAALRGVDFALRPGEVHALLGENGAGKSTLMNVISGVVGDYGGEMRLHGRPVRFTSPAAAQRHGVATVFQELDLVPTLSVADNLALGHEPRKLGVFADRRAADNAAGRALRRIDSATRPRDKVASLRLGERQAVLIARALDRDSRVLVLDEPTAALTAVEVDELFTHVRRLAAGGVAVVLVTHRFDEIARVADRVTVMRDGRVVATAPASISQHDLVPLLTGRTSAEMFPYHRTATDRPRLVVRGLTVTPARPRAGWCPPRHVDLTVHRGEIVGLVGLLGAGRTELLETLTGAAPAGGRAGTVEVDGAAVDIRSVRGARAAGIGFVPDDRRATGLVPQRSVAENLTLTALAGLTPGGFVHRRRERRSVVDALRRFGIRSAGPDVPVLSLSGGNQQKVVIGKALLADPAVLLLDEPTRGIDVGAKADIYCLLRARTAEGLAVLVASSELPELTGLCDRLVVLSRGRVVDGFPPGTGHETLLAAAGSTIREGRAS